MAEDNLTKDDLVLLMESYRNMITMHQTILDQSSKTIEKLDAIITKQDLISTKQGSICGNLNNIAGKLDEYATNLKDSTTSFQAHTIKSIEEHSKITNKIHLGWIGMGTIIVSLISLIFTMLHYVSDIQELISKL